MKGRKIESRGTRRAAVLLATVVLMMVAFITLIYLSLNGTVLRPPTLYVHRLGPKNSIPDLGLEDNNKPSGVLNLNKHQTLPLIVKARQNASQVKKLNVRTGLQQEFEPVPSFQFIKGLQGFLRPESYVLDLKLDFHGPDTKQYVSKAKQGFSGKVSIKIHCLQETTYIVLNSLGMVIDAYSSNLFQLPNNDILEISSIDYDAPHGLAYIHIKSALQNGGLYSLDLVFFGDLHKEPTGLFQSLIRDAASQAGFSMVATYLFPTYARAVFPCFDEPWMRATFEVSITRPVQYKSIANMPVLNREQKSDEFVQDTFQKTPPMPPHMFFLIVGNLFSAPTFTYHSHQIGVYSIGFKVDQSAYIFNVLPSIIQFFEMMFGAEYSLPKLDIAPIFSMPVNGMHGWGIISFKQALMFNRLNETRQWEKLEIINSLSHHVAHQWIGCLVGLYWWDSLWFIEGLAKYVAYYAASVADSSVTSSIVDTILINEVQASMELDASPNAKPVFTVFDTNRDIQNHIKKWLYLKGTSLVRMLAHTVSDEFFASVLKQFIQLYAFKTATPEQFYYILGQQQRQRMQSSVLNFTEIMHSWTSNTGYPVINVTRQSASTSVLVKQRMFYFMRATSLPEQLWYIPLTYTTASEKAFSRTEPRLWLNTESVTIQLQSRPEDWFLFNIKAVGYYRVNYDTENWKRLSNQLFTNHEAIHELNRAQLIDDAIDLARAGLLGYDIAFSILDYLKHEDSIIVWMAALDSLEKMNSVLHSSSVREKWRRFVLRLLPHHYDSVSQEGPMAEALILGKHRRDFVGVSCFYKYPACVTRAKAFMTKIRLKFSDYFTESVSLRGVFLCAVIRDGHDTTNFHYLLNLYKSLPAYNDQSDILKALSCTHDLKLLQALMIDSLNVGDTHQVAISLDKPQQDTSYLNEPQKHSSPRNSSFTSDASSIIENAIFNELFSRAISRGSLRQLDNLQKRILASGIEHKESWMTKIENARFFASEQLFIAENVNKHIDRFL